MLNKERGVNLTGFSPDELRSMIEKADQTGYCKGIPQGLLSQELAKRESTPVEAPVTANVSSQRFTQADFVDQLMEARRVPGWDKKK